MKTVMSNDMVAHVWAHQAQDHAQSHNGNFSFQDRTLYSYSTPIANIVDDINGDHVALITTETFSMTTSGKHMPALWRAVEYGRYMPAFRVPAIGAAGGRLRGSSVVDHAGNLAHFVASYEAAKAKMMRARDLWDTAKRLGELAEETQRYSILFGLPMPAFEVNLDAALILEAHRARQTPEAMAKREREAAKRAERKAIKDAEANRIAGLAWIDGGSRRPYGGPVLLRVFTSGRDGAKHLETSLGATVPLEHAVKVFRFVKLCREQGREWNRNGHTLRVGHFQVDHVSANGDFKAGCHNITWGEVERLASLLGLLDAAPSADGLEASQHAA